MFVFPQASNDSYVLLQARPEHPLLNFTVCLRSYTDLTRPHSLFSYATKAQDNEILLFKPKPGEYRFYVGGKYVTFRVPENRGEWEHVCASWESGSGIAEFWLNGRPWPRKGLQKGYVVGNEAVVVLGQEQDAYGGGFDVLQSFTGEMSDVYMWDFGLSDSEVKMLHYSEPEVAPIFGWRNFPSMGCSPAPRYPQRGGIRRGGVGRGFVPVQPRSPSASASRFRRCDRFRRSLQPRSAPPRPSPVRRGERARGGGGGAARPGRGLGSRRWWSPPTSRGWQRGGWRGWACHGSRVTTASCWAGA